MCITPSIEPSVDPLALGVDFMDASHQMLHEKLHQLSLVSDSEFAAAFEAMIGEVHEHFREEEQAMEDLAFPGISCHRDQHAQALNALQHAVLRVKAGAVAEGRDIAGLFAQWLSFHIQTMDRMLASVMQQVDC